MHAVEVVISGDQIKLGQFLKLANLVESGGHAKEIINDGQVQINGDVVRSRGHQLHDGDIVQAGPVRVQVVTAGDEDDYFDERTANDDFDPEKWRNM